MKPINQKSDITITQLNILSTWTQDPDFLKMRTRGLEIAQDCMSSKWISMTELLNDKIHSDAAPEELLKIQNVIITLARGVEQVMKLKKELLQFIVK